MKKIIALVLTLSFVFLCCACGSEEKTGDFPQQPVSVVNSSVESTIPSQVESEVESAPESEIESTSEPENEECEHVFLQANCTEPQICSKCQLTQGKALGHAFTNANCTEAQKCTRCGVICGNALGHDFATANCKAPQTCKRCAVTQGDLGGHDYVAGECSVCFDYDESYCPKLYFTGNMANMNSKKDVRDITFEYRSKDQIILGAAKIKPQGTSSLGYAKKNYTINLYSDSQYEEKMDINVGWGGQSQYCLKANWIDKTHSRNVVTAKLVGEMQEKYGLFTEAPNNGAVDGFPVEIYINGEFHGLYTMNIPKSEWMFNMDEENPDHIVLCGENWTAPVLFKDDPNLNVWSVEVGTESAETLEKFKRMTDFVRKSTDEEFKENFSEYLNLDATLNYYIMMHFGWMPDNVGKNMLMVTYDGKVWSPSLYDLDTTWGVDWKGQNVYDYMNSEMATESSLLWERMETVFSKEIAERYFDLRASVLDVDHVMNTFEEFYNSIPKEVFERETAKWGTNIPGYDLSQIEYYLNTYIPKLDEKFSSWQ